MSNTDYSAQEDELREEYFPSDFDRPFTRGKFSERMKQSCNVVVIRPELADAYPNGEAVNDALQAYLEIQQAAAHRH